MSNLTLSHSQVNKYSACSKKYEWHYIHKYREKVMSAALLFGSALDNTINEVLTDFKEGNLKPPSIYKSRFDAHWLKQKINKVEHELPECTLIAYAKSDFDKDLLTEYDFNALYDRLKQLLPNEPLDPNNKEKTVLNAFGKLNGIKSHLGLETMDQNSARFINLVNYTVLSNKGHLMITAYMKEVIPKLQEVIAVQKTIDLKNGEGDSVFGITDCIVKLKGDIKPRVMDLKTSSVRYEDDSASNSPQLAVYTYALAEEIDYSTYTGYIVLNKNIKKNKTKKCSICKFIPDSGSKYKTCNNEINGKRCNGEWIETLQPEAECYIVTGEITPYYQEQIVENYDAVLRAIKNKVFIKNVNACNDFGRKCEFYSKCFQGKEGNLIQLDDNISS